MSPKVAISRASAAGSVVLTAREVGRVRAVLWNAALALDGVEPNKMLIRSVRDCHDVLDKRIEETYAPADAEGAMKEGS